MNTGQIVKAKFNGQGFTLIPNTAMQNASISWQAKGLLGYLLSLPPDWVIYISELSDHATNGREATRSAFQELQDAGYILSVRVTDGNLTKGWNHIVYHSPQKADELPQTRNPVSTETREYENTSLQKKHSTKEIENKRKSISEKELLRLEIIRNLSNNGKTPEEIETLATSTVDEDFRQFSRLTEWIAEHTPNVAKMQEPITLRQFVKIREEIKDKAKITELLKNMQNWQPLLKKNVSAYQTLLNWAKRENK